MIIPAGERIPPGDPAYFLTKYSYKQGKRKKVLCTAVMGDQIEGKAAAAGLTAPVTLRPRFAGLRCRLPRMGLVRRASPRGVLSAFCPRGGATPRSLPLCAAPFGCAVVRLAFGRGRFGRGVKGALPHAGRGFPARGALNGTSCQRQGSGTPQLRTPPRTPSTAGRIPPRRNISAEGERIPPGRARRDGTLHALLRGRRAAPS